MSEQLRNSLENSDNDYLTFYHQADEFRSQGSLIKAAVLYNSAHDEVDQNSLDIEDLWRRCASLDMVVRCETDLQIEPSIVIQTMERYAAEIEKVFSSLNEGQKFDINLNPRSTSEINDFILYLKTLPDSDPELLTDDEIKRNWLLYYYISRWAFVMRIYYIRCTSQMDLAKQSAILSDLAAEKAKEWRQYTGEKVENAEFVLKDGPNQQRNFIREKIFKVISSVSKLIGQGEEKKVDRFLKKLSGVQDWANSYTTLQRALKMITEGDYGKAVQYFELIEEEIEKMNHTDKLGKEYECQLKAQKLFSQACISEENYDEAIKELRILFFSTLTQFPKIATEIKVYEARAALRYFKLEDAESAYSAAQDCNRKAKSSQYGITNKWLNLIEAQISLLRHGNPKNQTEEKKDFTKSLKEKALLMCSKFGSLCPDFIKNLTNDGALGVFNETEMTTLNLDEITEKFAKYSIQGSVINRPKAEYLPLEAQRLFVLGMVEIEQLKIEYDHQKYLNGVAYLLNAYAILLELDSKDTLLLDQIEEAYKEILRIDYTSSKFSEDRIDLILDNLNIEEVAKRNQLEQWTKALVRIITGQKFASKEDCEADFEATLERVIPPFIQSASKISLVKQGELNEWRLTSNEEFSVIKEGTIEEDGVKKFMTALYLNTHNEFNDEDHAIVIESAHELTRYTKASLMMIASALEKALKIHSLYKNSETGVVKDRQRLYDLSGPLTEILLDEATIEHRKRIREFIRIFCGEWNREHKDVLNMPFDTQLLLNVAGHHDTGKSESPLIVLFKPGSLNWAEFQIMMNHPSRGAEILYGLLGFDDVVKYELVHHIQEGNRRGYPWDLKGKSFQEAINDKIADDFNPLSETERKQLRQRKETYQGKRNRDVILSFDILEAMNAKTRPYREKLTLQELVGFAVSNIGINFPHYLVHAFIRYVNKGLFNELISHGKIPNGVKNHFELPVSYNLDDLIEYMNESDVFGHIAESGLDPDASVKALSAGKGFGVAISRECIRAEMFGAFMRTYKIDAEDTEEKFGKVCDNFVKSFENWAIENGKHSVDEYYGALGYSQKDIQEASNGTQSKVSDLFGSKK